MSRILLVLGLFVGIGFAVIIIAGKNMTTSEAYTHLPKPIQNQLQKLASLSQTASELSTGNQEKLKEIPQIEQLSNNSQVATFASRAAEVSTQAQQVLGETIKVNEDEINKDKPLHQKAIDNGLYLYCQQVVKEFEAQKSPTN